MPILVLTARVLGAALHVKYVSHVGVIGCGIDRAVPGQWQEMRSLKGSSSASFLGLAGPVDGVLPTIGCCWNIPAGPGARRYRGERRAGWPRPQRERRTFWAQKGAAGEGRPCGD